MARVNITNQTGRKTGNYFDDAKVIVYNEDTYWNGNNHISEATGSQWEHEKIYVTKGGKYILNHWSQFQGSTETNELISKDEAAKWFIKNNYKNEDIPNDLIDHIAKYEIE